MPQKLTNTVKWLTSWESDKLIVNSWLQTRIFSILHNTDDSVQSSACSGFCHSRSCSVKNTHPLCFVSFFLLLFCFLCFCSIFFRKLQFIWPLLHQLDALGGAKTLSSVPRPNNKSTKRKNSPSFWFFKLKGESLSGETSHHDLMLGQKCCKVFLEVSLYLWTRWVDFFFFF